MERVPPGADRRSSGAGRVVSGRSSRRARTSTVPSLAGDVTFPATPSTSCKTQTARRKEATTSVGARAILGAVPPFRACVDLGNQNSLSLAGGGIMGPACGRARSAFSRSSFSAGSRWLSRRRERATVLSRWVEWADERTDVEPHRCWADLGGPDRCRWNS